MWRRMRRSERHAEARTLDAAALLVEESESFLSGRYASDLWERHLPIPSWAWLAALAHAPAEVLAGWAADEPCPEWTVVGEGEHWWRALSLLSRELLNTAAAAGCPVETVQRAAVLNLELCPLGTGQGSAHPVQLVGDVLRSLERYRDSSHS